MCKNPATQHRPDERTVGTQGRETLNIEVRNVFLTPEYSLHRGVEVNWTLQLATLRDDYPAVQRDFLQSCSHNHSRIVSKNRFSDFPLV
jgi:hypothetical protein